jgi:hypothetical protein
MNITPEQAHKRIVSGTAPADLTVDGNLHISRVRVVLPTIIVVDDGSEFREGRLIDIDEEPIVLLAVVCPSPR